MECATAEPICQKPPSSLLTTKPSSAGRLSERLKSEDYNVLEADTGRAALDRMTEGVELVLLDYRLPDIDGVTLLRSMKEFDPDILVDSADGLRQRRDRSRGDEARCVSFREQAIQSG